MLSHPELSKYSFFFFFNNQQLIDVCRSSKIRVICLDIQIFILRKQNATHTHKHIFVFSLQSRWHANQTPEPDDSQQEEQHDRRRHRQCVGPESTETVDAGQHEMHPSPPESPSHASHVGAVGWGGSTTASQNGTEGRWNDYLVSKRYLFEADGTLAHS